MNIHPLYDTATSTISYIVHGGNGTPAAVIDPVLDFDQKSGRTSTQSADKILTYLTEHNLTLQWILETHAHADHLTAAAYLKEKTGGTAKIAIGEHIKDVQKVFGNIFNAEDLRTADGAPFDHLFQDGDTFSIGNIQAKVLHTPGHTPACVTYIISAPNTNTETEGEQVAFVGDTLFMPDYGTARCDFPGGSAHTLYNSIQKLFALPENTRLFMCHDYQPNGREPKWETTVKEEKEKNIHVGRHATEDSFVTMRTERDRTLAVPALLVPSIQVNARAGNLPPAEENGTHYLKIPLNKL